MEAACNYHSRLSILELVVVVVSFPPEKNAFHRRYAEMRMNSLTRRDLKHRCNREQDFVIVTRASTYCVGEPFAVIIHRVEHYFVSGPIPINHRNDLAVFKSSDLMFEHV